MLDLGYNKCVVCGEDVENNDINLEDKYKICYNCDCKVRSVYVDNEIRNDVRYKNINTMQMKQMQEFYAEAYKRKKQFVTTYHNANLCYDQEHGWFCIIRNTSLEMPFGHKIKNYSKPLEIFSIYDVVNIEYYFQLGSQVYGTIKININDKLLPYTPYNYISPSCKVFETREGFINRVAGIAEELKKLFPNAILVSPKDREKAELVQIYEKIKAEIDNIVLQKISLNSAVDQLMNIKLPDKCKALARQYLELDRQISYEIDRLQDESRYSSVTELKESKEKATSYLALMMNIYLELQSIGMK